MRVPVEEPGVEYLMQVIVQKRFSDLQTVVSVFFHTVFVRYGITVHKGHRKNALRGKLVNDPRTGNLRLIFQAQFPEHSGMLRFDPEVQFFLRDLLQFTQNPLQIKRFRLVIPLSCHIHHSGKFVQEDKILPHHVGDPRALHLCHDPGSVKENAIMHLPDRCRAERLIAKFTVYLIDALSGLLLDDRPRDFCLQRFHGAAQFLQLPAVTLRKHVGPAGHDLADLDIRGTEILQCRPQFLRSKTVCIKVVLRKYAEDLSETFFILFRFFIFHGLLIRHSISLPLSRRNGQIQNRLIAYTTAE